MNALTNGKAWGLFAKSAMMPDIDRQYRVAESLIDRPATSRRSRR
jgi:alkaline phosphatase